MLAQACGVKRILMRRRREKSKWMCPLSPLSCAVRISDTCLNPPFPCRYEEAHFTRLPSKRKAGASGRGTREALDELVELGDLSSAPSRGAGLARKKARSVAARRYKGKGKKRKRSTCCGSEQRTVLNVCCRFKS